MDLHACGGCGTARARGAQDLRDGGNGALTSVYAGTCAGCGRQWSIAFILPATPPAAGRIGGSEPSAILDPGEWLWVSDQDAGFPASGVPSPGDRARLLHAAAAADEAVKFIPPDDRVPAAAFTSPLGRAMLEASPERFLKSELLERARLYRAGAAPPRERRSRQMAG
jgi:hypothetical protein